jgi:methyl-accepting chemotaxis protein
VTVAAQASQEVERVYSNCWQNVRETTARVEGVTDRLVIEAESLAQSIRVVTEQVHASTGVAARLADTAFATQNFVAGLGQATRAMQSAAEELHHMLQRTEMAALNAGIEAAHAGDSGRGFAIVATEMKQLARTGGTALTQMLGVVGDLKQQTGALCERVQQIGEAVQAQHEFGHALSHAAMLQADAVGRVIRQIEAAHGEVRTLTTQMRDPPLPAQRLGVSPSARQAVERLPGYADAMADILRGLPDLSTIERTKEST